MEAYNLFNTAEVNLFWPVTSKPASFSWHLNMKFSKKVLTIGDQFVFYERYNFAKQSLYLHLHWLILYKNLYNFFQISPQVSRFRSSSVSFLSFLQFYNIPLIQWMVNIWSSGNIHTSAAASVFTEEIMDNNIWTYRKDVGVGRRSFCMKEDDKEILYMD